MRQQSQCYDDVDVMMMISFNIIAMMSYDFLIEHDDDQMMSRDISMTIMMMMMMMSCEMMMSCDDDDDDVL